MTDDYYRRDLYITVLGQHRVVHRPKYKKPFSMAL